MNTKKIWYENNKRKMNSLMSIQQNTWIQSAKTILMSFHPGDVLLYPEETVWHGYLMDETQTQSRIKDDIDNLPTSFGSAQYVQSQTPRPICLKEYWPQNVKQPVYK